MEAGPVCRSFKGGCLIWEEVDLFYCTLWSFWSGGGGSAPQDPPPPSGYGPGIFNNIIMAVYCVCVCVYIGVCGCVCPYIHTTFVCCILSRKNDRLLTLTKSQ